MNEFNRLNRNYLPHSKFNDESGIFGFFGEVYYSHCKLYRFDGTLRTYFTSDYRAKRGLLIRDHYTEWDVVKVNQITNNLVDFLKQEKIEHTRTDFKKMVYG